MCNRVCASQNCVKHLILVIVLLFHVFSWKNIYHLQSLINNTQTKYILFCIMFTPILGD